MRDQANIDYMATKMVRHIELSGNKPEAIYLWKGILAGCLEFGIDGIDKADFDRMLALLPKGPEDEIMKKIFHID